MTAVNLLKQTLQQIQQKVPEMIAAASVTAKQLELPSEKWCTKTPARLRHDGESEVQEDERAAFKHHIT